MPNFHYTSLTDLLNNNGFDIIPPGSHNAAGIPGLEILQSQIPGLRKRVLDWNP